MNTPENPPAFPDSDQSSFQTGMSRRDYFAAAALQGWYASLAECPMPSEERMVSLAYCFYRQADAMLAERQKQKESR